MKVILLVIFVALSLSYGVQGEAQCIKESGVNSFCGCQLKDSSNNTLINITLNFGKKTLRHDLVFQYTYSPCSGNSDCDDGKAAVCRHTEGDPFSHKSIGSLNGVTYKVNNPTHVNVSAIYLGPDGDTTSVVFLVCGDDKNNGSFTFLRHHGKTYYFQLSYSNFCIPPAPTTIVVTTTMNSNTSIPTMTTTKTSMTTATSTPTKTTTPTSTPTKTSTSTTSTPTKTSTSTTTTSTKSTPTKTSTSTTSTPTKTSTSTTSTPTKTSTSTTSTSTTSTSTTSTSTTSTSTTSTPTKTSTSTTSTSTTSTPTKTSTSTMSTSTTSTPTKTSTSTTSTPTKTSTSTTSAPTKTTTASSSAKVTSTSSKPSPTNNPSKSNIKYHERKVLEVVLPIVAAIAIIILVVIIIVYLRRRRKQDQYERLPEM